MTTTSQERSDDHDEPEMTTASQQFDLEKLGQWSEPAEFEVTRERIVSYAEATNDTIAQHAAGDCAPPVFAVVPAFFALAGATAGVVPADLVMRILHGEQDFRFHRAIEPGMTLTTRAAPVGVHQHSSGVVVAAKGETVDGAGEPVVEQYMATFVRGAEIGKSAGEPPPEHGFDEALRAQPPLATVQQSFDADQTFRYSEASGDPMPIHLDDDLAKAVGLPGIIIHGLCTMAFTSRAVIETACPEDPRRLRRLAVRFAKVVQPEETIATAIWRAGEVDRADGGADAYAFETTSEAGTVVIKDGLAEIAR